MLGTMFPSPQEILQAIDGIPFFNTISKNRLKFSPLGGLSNYNILVEVTSEIPGTSDTAYPPEKFVLRLPGEDGHLFVNRANEKHNAMIAEELGLNSKILYFSPEGVQLSCYLSTASVLQRHSFSDDLRLNRIAMAFRRLHGSDQLFANDFSPLETLGKYLQQAEEMKIALSSELLDMCQRISRRARELEKYKAPSHCDPVAGNLLDDGTKIYMIDWEYSGNADPMWDLAYLALTEELSPEKQNVLLCNYFDGKIPDRQKYSFLVHFCLSGVISALWGFIRHDLGNSNFNYRHYAQSLVIKSQRQLEEIEAI
ncbi:phosphotransferase family protein [Kiloniella laminariae]|uniref:Phosphotransferase family protein n=1 Tax=Kiloniella laminariae TaxID=454162 RepID=A0ABT4LNV7_9PROT|nr:choline/ethanolamine kinase family protein [Kiloniella laminariae]MCZ4282783.1 phosphotransferase family protein [Kiloniella laminariae]